MKRYPVVLATSHGRVAGVVHEPEAEPAAGVVLLHGGTGRSGPNRVWVRLAESLAAAGLVAFRTDDRDVEDPAQNDDYALRAAIATEAIEWFAGETSGLDLLIVGRCMGAQVCMDCAAALSGVIGVGLIAPRFHHLDPTLVERAGGAFGTLKRAAFRAMPRLTERVARKVVSTYDQSRLDPGVTTALAEIHCPLWVLLGDGDRQWLSLFTPEGRPAALAGAEFEIVPDTIVHTNRTLRSQEVVVDRVTAWAVRRIGSRESA